jgi:hypothetical protein
MEEKRGPFRLLLDLFLSRFMGNDAVSPEGGFETNIYQVMGFLATPGFIVSLYLMPAFMQLAIQPPGPAVDWALRTSRLFFPAYSFAVTGFATLFEWDMLFPDRRDFLILASFPIRLRDLFGAKFSALGLFLVALTVAVNLFPTLMVPLISMSIPQVSAVGGMRITLAQIASTWGASVFAFVAVAAFQGILINITSPRLFRRISPWIQLAGMSLMILALLLFPIYSMMLRTTTLTHPHLLWFLPPVWFTGMYDLLTPRSDAFFRSLGVFGIEATGFAMALFALAWTLGFQRYYRRTLEAEDTASRIHRNGLAARLISSPEERAIFLFSGKTLARSAKHRMFLATYLSVGVSIGLLVAGAVRGGRLAVSRDGLRSLPLLIVFFVVSGFRTAFQFPAELASNWLFRITEDRWAETSRSATRKRVLISGLVPALLVFLPMETGYWGWAPGFLHILFQLAAGAMLIEILFWSFAKVPFTCSYFPGRMNLSLLVGLYLYGFTSYSFHMADLEASLDGNGPRALLFFAAAGLALTLLWRRHPAPLAVSFDAAEPHIQTLDLT